jgi:hypothetical protein
MQYEIPAGTKVQVAVTSKGVTTMQDAEVLAHMDGLVHVQMNGEVVSIDPSQIQVIDPPALRKKNDEPGEVGSSAGASNKVVIVRR